MCDVWQTKAEVDTRGKKHGLESRSRRRRAHELQREQQANIFNPRDHAGMLIQTHLPSLRAYLQDYITCGGSINSHGCEELMKYGNGGKTTVRVWKDAAIRNLHSVKPAFILTIPIENEWNPRGDMPGSRKTKRKSEVAFPVVLSNLRFQYWAELKLKAQIAFLRSPLNNQPYL